MYLMKKICFLVLILSCNIYAQLKLKMSTDKYEYGYGEKIIITATVSNISDSTIVIIASCYNSAQAEFEFNDYYSANWTACYPRSQELIFLPKSSRNYMWIIDPQIFGLPNQNGLQRIVTEKFIKNVIHTYFNNNFSYIWTN